MTYPGFGTAQTIDVVRAVWVPAQSAIVGLLRPQSYGRRIVLMELLGPSNTVLTIYRGPDVIAGFRVARVFPASARTYDSTMGMAPMLVYAGQSWAWAWTGGSAGATAPNNAAQCTVTSEVF